MTTTKKNGNMVAIITMFFIFAMISFVTNMAAPFGTIWGYTYEWAGMMGNMMNFAAYLFMGIPAGKMLTTVGYKKTSLIALAVGFIGLLVQYLSSIFGADIAVFSVGGQAVAGIGLPALGLPSGQLIDDPRKGGKHHQRSQPVRQAQGAQDAFTHGSSSGER